ncbi:MAG: hypothetical protein BZ151_11780 [Desulfobacca sp. 4484_104]|nr:MAG: hypothetical protein BZ151_11780 [Desulfobacca sp. 4484_104]RLA88861.1 MAG: CopG family transcriptional regulator [Deltaproteobacteria bacterium]
MAGKRIIITLSEADKRWLDGYAQAHKISVSEAVRKGLAILRRQGSQDTYSQLVEKTKGIWHQGDGLAYQQALRSEWDQS